MLTWERSKLIFSVLYCNVGVIFKYVPLQLRIFSGNVRVESLDGRKASQRSSKTAGRIKAYSETFRTVRHFHLETRYCHSNVISDEHCLVTRNHSWEQIRPS